MSQMSKTNGKDNGNERSRASRLQTEMVVSVMQVGAQDLHSKITCLLKEFDEEKLLFPGNKMNLTRELVNNIIELLNKERSIHGSTRNER